MKTVIKAGFTISDKLLAAHEAVAQLQQRGLTARSVSINGAQPVIVIDRPKDEASIANVQHIRERKGGLVSRSIKAAPFHGCQLQWDECASTEIVTRH